MIGGQRPPEATLAVPLLVWSGTSYSGMSGGQYCRVGWAGGVDSRMSTLPITTSYRHAAYVGESVSFVTIIIEDSD